MSKLLSFALSFFILVSITQAAEAQVGCFTTNFNSCYGGSISCYSLSSSNIYSYGYTVASVCSDFNNAKDLANAYQSQLNSCTSSYNSLAGACGATTNALYACKNDYNALVARYNQNLDTFNLSLTLIQAMNKRISKLKKTCGSKCKRL